MKIIWDLNDTDIKKVVDFVHQNNTPFVQNRIDRNIKKKELVLDKDIILKTMLNGLLSKQADSSQDKRLSTFFSEEPFLLTSQFLSNEYNIEMAVKKILVSNGITPSSKTIDSFILNYFHLVQSNWEILHALKKCISEDCSPSQERDLADHIDKIFKGFGSTQARTFLQDLGIIKYEIPINASTMAWLRDFGFPIFFSPIALQDKSFYHFVSNGIQLLCDRANIFPCVLDAAISSMS